MNQTPLSRVYCSFHLISCGFHHLLPGSAVAFLHCIKPDSSSIGYSPAVRQGNSAEAPPSAAANDDALLGPEQNCVREIYTHNTPGGSGEKHHTPKHRHSITFYMIARRAGNNGAATMSFCITDKCLIWLTQLASVSVECHQAHGKMDDSYTIETLCSCNNHT